MWKNIVQPDTQQMLLWRLLIACRTPKATNTHSEYVMFIALPRQQCLHECPSMLRYTYIPCLVISERECVHFAPSSTDINSASRS